MTECDSSRMTDYSGQQLFAIIAIVVITFFTIAGESHYDIIRVETVTCMCIPVNGGLKIIPKPLKRALGYKFTFSDIVATSQSEWHFW